MDKRHARSEVLRMNEFLLAVLPVLLISGVPSSPAPAPLWTDDGNLLAVPLAHRERDRIDAGVLSIDRRRRVVTWSGLAEEIGCRLRLEAGFDDVRGIETSRGAGLTLTLRSGAVREMILAPPAHYAVLALPIVRPRGGITREEAIAGGLRTDNGEGYADTPGSGAFAGPTGRTPAVSEAARRDTNAVAALLRKEVGLKP